MARSANITRVTSETKVAVSLDLDGTGASSIATGVGFFDHMLTAFAKHGLFDLVVQTDGDLHIDAHHSVEDTAIGIGQAFAQALGDRAGIRRFGDVLLPMDEALVQCSVDISGRPYLVYSEPAGAPPSIGASYTTTLTQHVFEALAQHAGLTLHLKVLAGRDWHHITEAQYKGVARALRVAVELDPRVQGIPSTKGVL